MATPRAPHVPSSLRHPAPTPSAHPAWPRLRLRPRALKTGPMLVAIHPGLHARPPPPLAPIQSARPASRPRPRLPSLTRAAAATPRAPHAPSSLIHPALTLSAHPVWILRPHHLTMAVKTGLLLAATLLARLALPRRLRTRAAVATPLGPRALSSLHHPMPTRSARHVSPRLLLPRRILRAAAATPLGPLAPSSQHRLTPTRSVRPASPRLLLPRRLLRGAAATHLGLHAPPTLPRPPPRRASLATDSYIDFLL